MQKKVKNAKEAGVRCATMTNPSKEAIDAFKKRRPAGRGRDPKPNKAAGLADAPDAAADQVAGGAAVESFYSNLTDITADIALCATCDGVDGDGADGRFGDADGEPQPTT